MFALLSYMFSKKLIDWYSDFGRNLPWRNTDNPYYIWLSEIILQQTRIEQGLSYYHRFVEEYPTVRHLAEASEEQILKTWQGLGYYSRARNLHAATQYICNSLNGMFPDTYEGILSLKGVGRYTAAAIASFAFRLPYPVIDGNVYRFISRIKGIFTPIATNSAYNEFETILLKEIDSERPDLFNQAMMDFGSIFCTPQHPHCMECPFADQCYALKYDKVSSLPVKAASVKVKERWFYYFHLENADGLLVHQRQGKDIWKGLYEFPLMESELQLSHEELSARADSFFDTLGISVANPMVICEMTHKLTHRTIHATFLRANLVNTEGLDAEKATLIAYSDVKKIPVSRLIDKYLKKYC